MGQNSQFCWVCTFCKVVKTIVKLFKYPNKYIVNTEIKLPFHQLFANLLSAFWQVGLFAKTIITYYHGSSWNQERHNWHNQFFTSEVSSGIENSTKLTQIFTLSGADSVVMAKKVGKFLHLEITN